MKRVRRLILELWAIVMVAVVVGFLGPFGSYLAEPFPARVLSWWMMLVSAYVLVRPIMLGLRWIAKATDLPRGSLVFWGVILASVPMAWLWRAMAREETRLAGGDYTVLVPFALLCSLMVMTVMWWAERADAHLLRHYDPDHGGIAALSAPAPAADRAPSSRPRLYRRLGPGFQGEILALESEDHYVRVHGAAASELLFLRLRDAIAEMDGVPGEQTHRSWWIARDAVAGISGTGRTRQVRLVNGARAPVARDSIDRLQRAGFLPA